MKLTACAAALLVLTGAAAAFFALRFGADSPATGGIPLRTADTCAQPQDIGDLRIINGRPQVCRP